MNTSTEIPVALVTGANRGIGFEVCRQLARRGYAVLLGSRDHEAGETATNTLAREGLTVHALTLDIADAQSVMDAAKHVGAQWGRLTVLVNNAGGFYDADQKTSSADLSVVVDALQTNLLGTWRMCQAFVPLLRQSAPARIVNVSSEAASFVAPQGLASAGYGSSGGGLPAYGVSKAALNALTVKLAAELAGSGVLVNAVCPGYTATHPEAVGGRPVSDGAASVVWAATLESDGPTGGFWRDGKPLSW